LLRPPMATHASKSYLCAGSSSFDDPDVVEVSPAAAAAGGWATGHNKRKRSQVMLKLPPPLFAVRGYVGIVVTELGIAVRVDGWCVFVIAAGLYWEKRLVYVIFL